MKSLPSLKFNIHSPFSDKQINNHLKDINYQIQFFLKWKWITILQAPLIIWVLIDTNFLSKFYVIMGYSILSIIIAFLSHVFAWEFNECKKNLLTTLEDHRLESLKKALNNNSDASSKRLAIEYISFVTQSRELTNYEAEELINYLNSRKNKIKSKDLLLPTEANEDVKILPITTIQEIKINPPNKTNTLYSKV